MVLTVLVIKMMIVKYSFPMTKKESSNEDYIVVFLTEKFVHIVDKVVTVKEEKDYEEQITIWTVKNIERMRYT